jgi:hypothetical protein
MRLIALAEAACMLVCSAATAATVTPVQSWNGSTGYVFGRPFVAPGGVIYGVLGYGISSPTGSVYALAPPASAGNPWTQTTISSFSGGATGGSPVGGLINDAAADPSGDLYGAAFTGGSTAKACSQYSGCGVIYRLSPPASGTAWTRTVLYTFQGGADGSGPVGDLVADSTGALYGATEFGGCTATLVYPSGCGVIFKLTPPSSGTTWTETVLYRFHGGTTDGVYPGGRLALDAKGNIYGTTLFGGAEDCGTASGFQVPDPDGGCGIVFELVNNAGAYTESVLHYFTDGSDGSVPASGLVLDKVGDVYGAAVQGGNETDDCAQYGFSGCGVIFEMQVPTAKKPGWTKLNILTLNGADGGYPTGLLRDYVGKLYAEATYNTVQDSSCPGNVVFYCGTVIELRHANGVWTETVLRSFNAAPAASPMAGPEFSLAVNGTNELFGVTEYGTTSTVFSVKGSKFTAPPVK